MKWEKMIKIRIASSKILSISSIIMRKLIKVSRILLILMKINYLPKKSNIAVRNS